MEKMVELMKSIWKEGIIPQDWRNGIIVPLHKRGDKEKIENYRNISPMYGLTRFMRRY